MTVSEPSGSSLTRLVVFMICLSLAGSCIAGMYYFSVDLPRQNALKAPDNDSSGREECVSHCADIMESCNEHCNKDKNCLNGCWDKGIACVKNC